MDTAGPKMHFVPLGDIHETPHINDTFSIRPRQIRHLSTGLKQADPAPIQARDLFVLGNSMAIRKISRQGLFNAKDSTTQPQISGGLACRAGLRGLPRERSPFSPSGEKVAVRPDEGAFLECSVLKWPPPTRPTPPIFCKNAATGHHAASAKKSGERGAIWRFPAKLPTNHRSQRLRKSHFVTRRVTATLTPMQFKELRTRKNHSDFLMRNPRGHPHDRQRNTLGHLCCRTHRTCSCNSCSRIGSRSSGSCHNRKRLALQRR